MFTVLRKCFAFMTRAEKGTYILLTSFRSLISILDLLGVLAIGYLATSIALFVSEGSDQNRAVSIGSIHLPAVNIHSLPWVVTLILMLFILKAGFSLWLTRRTAIAIALIEARSAKAITEYLLARDQKTMHKLSRDEVIYLVQLGSPSAFNGLLNAISTLVSEGFLFILLVSSLLFVDFAVTIGMLVYFALVGTLIQYLVGGRMQKAGSSLAASALLANSTIGDLISVNRELRLTGRRGTYVERIYVARKNAAVQLATQAYLAGAPRHVIETSLLLGIAGFGVIEALSGNLVAAATTLGVFLTGGFRIMASMLPLQTALISIKGSMPNAEPALNLLAEIEAEPHPSKETLAVLNADGLVAKSLAFKYPGSQNYALVDVDFSIKKGDQVALIGESGSGKSTLGEILAGIISPTAGSLLIDGSPAEIYVSQHPGKVAIVPQAPGRIAGTILDNLTLGQSADEVDLNAVERAIAQAHLLDVIRQLPDGIHTDLGKHNDALSGGQLQRLGLARALYTQPEILVLDEATSGLDANSEYEIGLALEDLRGRVTTILIAHRLHTVKNADVVYLLESGRIVASGKFSELVRVAPQVEQAVLKSSVQIR